MSLINDALKRARDAERNRPAAPQPPLAPAESASVPRPAAKALLVVLIAGAILLSGISFWKWAHHPPTTPHTQPLAIAVPPASVDPAPENGAGQTVSAPALPLALPLDPVTEPTEELSEPQAEQVVTSANPEPVIPAGPPELRLQSIIYRLNRPSVVINGEMLQVGDAIAGGKVIDIQRHAVTVQRGDSNIVLKVPSI
jgi:hypothetical protein